MAAGRGPSFMNAGGRRVVAGSCFPGVGVEASLRDALSESVLSGLSDSDFGAGSGRTVSDLGAGLTVSDFGAAGAAWDARTTLPHWGQATSWKSWAGAMSKE